MTTCASNFRLKISSVTGPITGALSLALPSKYEANDSSVRNTIIGLSLFSDSCLSTAGFGRYRFNQAAASNALYGTIPSGQAPKDSQTFLRIIQGEQTYRERGILRRATSQEWGESFTATCGTPSPKATLAASGEENETAVSGRQFSISWASFITLRPLARSLPKREPPPCSPTMRNRNCFNLSASTASRYVRVVSSSSCPSWTRSR